MRAHFGLPSVEKEEVEGRPPIGVKFEIPYFTVSGIQVKGVGKGGAPLLDLCGIPSLPSLGLAFPGLSHLSFAISLIFSYNSVTFSALSLGPSPFRFALCHSLVRCHLSHCPGLLPPSPPHTALATFLP